MVNSQTTDQQRVQKAIKSLTSGADELISILVYILVIRKLLQGLWRLGKWVRMMLTSGAEETATAVPADEDEFEASLLGALTKPARQLGWSMLLLWLVDAAYIVAAGFSPKSSRSKSALKFGLPRFMSIVLYSNVAGRVLAAIKNWWLERGVLLAIKPPPSAAQRAIARRGSGILLWSAVILVCAEGVCETFGMKLNSILSFAGVGGIAVGLATKDLLTNLVGGALLFLTTPFVERDKITMTNLEQSRVLRVGWYQTIVRGDNEEVQSIPNARFISNKISNRSRRTHRCMKTSFHLEYDALPQMEELIDEMRDELLALPTVDAKAREFRLYVKRLTQTAIEVEAEVHFRGNDGTKFRYKRQNALLTIAAVVRRRGARFAVLNSLLADGSSGAGQVALGEISRPDLGPSETKKD